MIEIGRRIVRSVLLYVSVGDSECLAKCPQGSNTNTDSVIKCKKEHCGHLDSEIEVEVKCLTCRDKKQPMVGDLWDQLKTKWDVVPMRNGTKVEENTPHFMYRYVVPPGRYTISCR